MSDQHTAAAGFSPKILHYRSIWISDVHLGARGCQAEKLLDFLRCTKSDYLYLVGDILDTWQFKRLRHWPKAKMHGEVIQAFFDRAREGTKTFLLPGNHDEALRDFCGLQFGAIKIVDKIVHETIKGERYLVMHGDQFDSVLSHAKWLARIGDVAYTIALVINYYYNYIRQKLGFSYWSLSAYLKNKVKKMVERISDQDSLIVQEAERYNVKGVVCGHIHRAEIRAIGSTTYCNDGDWVESCTALVEDFNGNLTIIDWLTQKEGLLKM